MVSDEESKEELEHNDNMAEDEHGIIVLGVAYILFMVTILLNFNINTFYI